MLLAIDIGNSNSVFRVYEGTHPRATFRLKTDSLRTDDEYAALLAPLLAEQTLSLKHISAAVIGSVVPEANRALLSFLKTYTTATTPYNVQPDNLSIPLVLKLEHQQNVGADRIINAIAAKDIVKPPFIVVDFGTGTTFDVVDSEGAYIGGAISPGLAMTQTALHLGTAKLPRVALEPTPGVIGRSTVSAMQSGLYWGYVAMIEGMIARIKTELNAPTAPVVATGGLAPLLAQGTKCFDHVDVDLTLTGLAKLYYAQK